jgi:hypothetical protein
MKQLTKSLTVAAALFTGIVGMSIGTSASAHPWGSRVIIKKQCWMTRWGHQCRIVERVRPGRGYHHRWHQNYRRNYYAGPNVIVSPPSIHIGW